MNRLRYRVFLFLIVLALPTLVIIVQSGQNAEQERKNTEQAREIAAQKRVAQHRRTVEEVSQDILRRLQQIKLQEIGNAPAVAVSQAAAHSDSAVAFVGREENDRVIWPWDVKQPPAASPEESDFIRKIAEAERAELREHDYAQAAVLYREAIVKAGTDAERASARIPLARVLTRSGDKPEAVRVYRELLNLPSALADDQSLSFASSAAYGFAQLHVADTEALDRVKRDLDPGAPLAPSQAIRLQLILEALQMSKAAKIREAAASTVMEQLAARMNDFNAAADIQENYRKLRVATDSWQPYAAGNTLWWLGKASTGASSLPLVLAVRVEEVRKSVEADRRYGAFIVDRLLVYRSAAQCPGGRRASWPVGTKPCPRPETRSRVPTR